MIQIEQFYARHGADQDLRVEIFGELRKSGKNFKATCPHCKGNDCEINSIDPIYYCHNCGTGGNWITALEAKGMKFVEAAKYLFSLKNEVIKFSGEHYQFNNDEIKLKFAKKQASKEIQPIFQAGLRNSPRAIEYLKSRKISLSEGIDMGLGYFGSEALAQVNAILSSKELPVLTEFYSDRISIPLTLSALGATDYTFRAVSNQVSPKYLNSPGTSKTGFSGLIRRGNFPHLAVVEGYFDCLLLNHKDQCNPNQFWWLGLGGCDISSLQVDLVLNFLDEHNLKDVTFCLDSDKAGFKSVQKTFCNPDVLKKIGNLKTKFYFFSWDRLYAPEIKDPLDFFKNGYNYLEIAEIVKDVETTRNIFDFLVFCCFVTSDVFLNEHQLNIGISRLADILNGLDLAQDLAPFKRAIAKRFKDDLSTLEQIDTFLVNQIDLVEKSNYLTHLSNWSLELTKVIQKSDITQINKLLLSQPKPIKGIELAPPMVLPTDDDLLTQSNFLPSYYASLDSKINGFTRGGLHIIAGRPGQGKTSFLLNLARMQLANNENSKVLFLTLEESSLALYKKFLICCSDQLFGSDPNQNYNAFHTYLKEHRKTKPNKIFEDTKIWVDDLISSHKFFIISPESSHIEDLSSILHSYVTSYGFNVLLIDYVQKISSKELKEKNYLLGKLVADSLHSIALNYSIPVIAGSQFNRAPDSRGDKRPELSDLRESGDFEQSACLVLALYTANKPNDDIPSHLKDLVKILALKSREGQKDCEINMCFKRHTRRFNEHYSK